MTKSRRALNSSGTNKSSSGDQKRKEPTIVLKEQPNNDDGYNSGFSNYLRSPEGVNMLTLFVIANSIVVIFTMAWPNMKELYKIIREFIVDEEEL